MRRFILIALVLVLVIALAGSLTGAIFLYDSHQQKQTDLDDSATRAAGLENELGDTQLDLSASERQLATLEGDNQSLQRRLSIQEEQIATLEGGGQLLQEQIATLEAEIARPPLPTPTPPTRPTVFVTAPTPGDQFQEREIVTIRWNATNPDGIGRVTLKVDGRPVRETTVNGQHSAEGEFTWLAIGIGDRQLTIVAANTLGAEGAPVSVTIEVIPASESQPSSEKQNAAIMDSIEPVVVELRGLEPLRPVTRTLFTRADLEQFIVQELDEDFAPDEARRDAIEMSAFDFIPADTDLRAMMTTLYTEQIAGFYDTDTQSLAVVKEEAVMGPMDKTVYAHEFTHALQDQHFGLEALDPEENSDDASLAVTALIEGDATMLMQEYMLAYLDPDELFEMLSESLEAGSEALDSAPAVIRAQLMFPYEAGLEFVSTLYLEGGYAAVDDAFLDPPQSTEQILHPEKYLAGETPQVVTLPPLTETLGSGWEWVDENVLGEFALRLYLEQQLSDQGAAAAADGWGGDRYAVHHRPETGAIVMVMRTVWDTTGEAAEFMDNYLSFGKARFGAAPEEVGAAVCWSGDDAICAYQTGAETLIIRAPDMGLVAELESLFPDF